MKRIFFVFFLLLSSSFTPLLANHITFGRPIPLPPQARTDKAISLAAFGAQPIAFWKAPGHNAPLYMGRLAGTPPNVALQEITRIAGARTSFAPVCVATPNALLLFWINEQGGISYGSPAQGTAGTDTSFRQLALRSKPGGGLSVAVLADGRIALSSLKAGTHKMWLALLALEGSELRVVKEYTLKMARSTDYPQLATEDNLVRVTWSRLAMVNFATYDAETDQWSANGEWPDTESKGSPSLYTQLDGERSVWVWNAKGNSKQIQYLISGPGTERVITDFPTYFEPIAPVSFCAIDENNFMMAYPGADQKLYLSFAAAYDPASWMEQYLFPKKAEYTLKDIVLPGAHDAGMSLLTARGGKSGYTINECNTLTQVIPVAQQLAAGIRMFDLRIDLYKGALYAKHAPSDCMDDAVGGGWGEPLKRILDSVRGFLDIHNKEFVLLSFAHFCERNMSLEAQAKTIIQTLGANKVFHPGDRKLNEIPLKDLAGKVVITFEGHAFPELGISSNSMTDRSTDFMNYVRAYAATNRIDSLLEREKRFFEGRKNNVDANDYVRLDWQLTQIGQEAAISCSQFQSSKSNPFLDGALLLTNVLAKNKSIIDLARIGNRFLPGQIDQWIKNGVIDKSNKPHILYVDVADTWITDFCIDLNESALYTK